MNDPDAERRDLDYWQARTPSERIRALEAIRRSWLKMSNPGHDRVDILTSILGVGFEAAWEGRFVGRYGNQEVTFIGRRDLISAKEAAGRPQDREDLRVLRTAEREKPF